MPRHGPQSAGCCNRKRTSQPLKELTLLHHLTRSFPARPAICLCSSRPLHILFCPWRSEGLLAELQVQLRRPLLSILHFSLAELNRTRSPCILPAPPPATHRSLYLHLSHFFPNASCWAGTTPVVPQAGPAPGPWPSLSKHLRLFFHSQEPGLAPKDRHGWCSFSGVPTTPPPPATPSMSTTTHSWVFHLISGNVFLESQV